MRLEFTIDNVIEAIDDVSPPTPTEGEEYDAVWWNTSFGIKIKNSFQETLDQLANKINQMAEY